MSVDASDAVLLLGDDRLRRLAAPVESIDDPAFLASSSRLASALDAFRRARGFGRAIAAPQLGIAQRFIALNLGDGPRTIVNPIITWASEDRVTMWDDCMSFPDLLVRVARHRSISVTFTDETGAQVEWDRLDVARAELLQHEIDHLDGVLAVDRAIDRDALVLRAVFDANPRHFLSQVEYVISAPAYDRA